MRNTMTLALCAAVLSAGAAHAQEQMKVHHFVPPKAFPHSRFIQPWAEKVEKESGGKLKFQIFPAMQMGGTPPQLFDQAKDGVADIVWTLPGYTAGRFPKTEVMEIPFLHTNALATTLALQDFYDAHLKDEYKDVHVLLLHCHDGFIVHANKQILKMDDFKGLKIRTANRAGNVLLRAVGATAVGAPVPEIPQMLSKGVIDGALLPYEIALPLKVHELIKFHNEFAGIQPRVGTGVFLFAMNKKRYEALPADLKKVIDANSGRNIARATGQTWIDIEKPGREAAQAQKNSFPMMPESEVMRIRAAVKPEIDKFLKELSEKGFDAVKLYAEAQQLVAKYTAK
jgi:TRAP-type C4-dicarboxylate transport system substrate-binding protein